ncbi:single-stranded-DNA-specific exonuclease RecJ [Candidatus Roizmanbacteria bacterium RIFCSPHIGHO2_12_FULL_41_11]|uniref:Single-stranded-DNA-specific exonuclease RecJ n=2 Tax=Candidatus Roizmaniibacteriota TaxID=1752723 RepID=A0A1F7J8H6_9BACT|nr:MAG: single-stranded-DNA-specific exonuclease RecJ [Candidatus Roizmanbacteria bacterium RIFCSPHIGHO2_12_FULL_41_11]OGK51886.1 MAG: single-stranded-DNA-specific exonuclease RecJ [Candidatus Roizmanbacteria bacterium RIFCSPLOWO2_01_FULL_41_22]
MKVTYHHEIKSGQKLSIESLIDILMRSRQITNINAFLHPPSPLSLSLVDFGYEKEFRKILQLLKKIREEKKTIVVYTDYDADGITGGSILWETLHLLGFSVMPYVPHRKLEGYGFSIKGIDAVIAKYHPALIISVDHGITAAKQIAYAKTQGIKVIVTDHHLKQEGQVPKETEAIFHIPQLSGSGVAYFFAKEIYENLKSQISNFKLLEYNFTVDYLALASIGTIADLVPLVGPSRSVVKAGLASFPNVKRYGLKYILKEAKIIHRPVTPYEVGFIIAPRINAVGRLEHAIDALRLLCTTNEARALKLAQQVGLANTKRQDLVKKAVEEALAIVEKLKKKGSLPKILILHSPDWHEGIIGLIASKLVEAYYRPAIVLTEGNGELKGSARSIKAFHITDFFASLKKYLLSFGGHRQAGGLTVKKSQLADFIAEATNKASKLIKDSDLEKVIEVDIKIPVQIVDMRLAREIEKLNPFGIGNPQPSFVSQVEVVGAQLFGKKNDHLKIIVKSSDTTTLEMIAFNRAADYVSLSRGKKLDIVYNLNINRWNGRESLRGRVIELITSSQQSEYQEDTGRF